MEEILGEELGIGEVLLRSLPQEQEHHHMTLHVAVIGAGMAGLSCASRLVDLGHRAQIFEKSRGFGGRMSTRRTDQWECDHGAQYFTATDPDFQRVVNQWVQQGVAALWSPRIQVIGERRTEAAMSAAPTATERFVGTPRMTSPGQWLASGLEVQTSIRVTALQQEAAGWRLLDAQSNVIGDHYDAVILAIPAPQIPTIVVHHLPEWMPQVQAKEMLPCWSVMAEVDPTGVAGFDAAFVNDGPLSWIANNASKPGRGKTPMWTIHASPQWTQEHLFVAPEDAIPPLVQAFCEHTGLRVVNATAHRWLYSLPKTKVETGCLWDSNLRLGACGDWLLGGKVQGAWLSGRACADRVTR
jgi:renalase